VQAEWREHGLIKQRVHTRRRRRVVRNRLRLPPRLDHGSRLPAILACHGHGPFGKEPVMGNRSSAALVAEIETQNYDYGLRMAQAGFAVIAIDWRGFGERDDRRKPNANGLPIDAKPVRTCATSTSSARRSWA
jgi:hypothetical protein